MNKERELTNEELDTVSGGATGQHFADATLVSVTIKQKVVDD